MAADRARADEEDLKVSPFQKGEWEQTRPTELDVDYALLAEALGPAGAPVAEIHDATVVALALERPPRPQDAPEESYSPSGLLSRPAHRQD